MWTPARSPRTSAPASVSNNFAFLLLLVACGEQQEADIYARRDKIHDMAIEAFGGLPEKIRELKAS